MKNLLPSLVLWSVGFVLGFAILYLFKQLGGDLAGTAIVWCTVLFVVKQDRN